jgi:flagellar FliL protein
MATSPTVLANAPSSSPDPAPPQAKSPIVPIVIALLVGFLITALAVGGGFYYLVRSGRLAGIAGAAKAKPQPLSVAPAVTCAVTLEPMLVNLAGESGNSYLRLSLVLRVADNAGKKEEKPKEDKGKEDKSEAVAAIRDTTLAVLGRQTAEGLLAPDGKERLKKELKAALAEHNSELKVTDIFFTDFLVQQ